MARGKISHFQFRKLVIVSSLLAALAGAYYLLSPYQQCVRDLRIGQPQIAEGAVVNQCTASTTW